MCQTVVYKCRCCCQVKPSPGQWNPSSQFNYHQDCGNYLNCKIRIYTIKFLADKCNFCFDHRTICNQTANFSEAIVIVQSTVKSIEDTIKLL